MTPALDSVFFTDQKKLQQIIENCEPGLETFSIHGKKGITEEEINFLVNVSDEIISSQEMLEKYQGYNLEQINISLPHLFQRVDSLNGQYEKLLEKTVWSINESVEISSREIKKLNSAELIDEIKAKRGKTDETAQLYGRLSRTVLSTPRFASFSRKNLDEYLEHKELRQSILDDLSFIEKKYHSMQWNSKSQPLLKAFLSGKKGLFGFLKKSPLGDVSLDEIISGFNRIEYFEGAYEARELKLEISAMADNLPEILAAKTGLEEAIKDDMISKAETARIISAISSAYPDVDKQQCARLSSIYLQKSKEDYERYSGMSYISGMVKKHVSEKKEVVESIEKGIMVLYDRFESGMRKLVINIENEKNANHFLDRYEDFLMPLDSILDPHKRKKALSEITGAKGELLSQQYASRLQLIRERVSAKPASLRDVDCIQLLLEASGELEELADDPRNPYKANAKSLKASVENEMKKYSDAEKIQERKDRPIIRPLFIKKLPSDAEHEKQVPMLETQLISKPELYTTLANSGERPFLRGEGDYFDLPTYLSYIGLNTNYHWFKDTMNSSAMAMDEKLMAISKRLEKGHTTSEKDYDYAAHLFYALSESMNRGNLNPDYSKKTAFRQVADATISCMSAYLERSQHYLGMSQKSIDEHSAITGPKNRYNKELCSKL